MHLRHNESGFLGSNAIVGGGVPLAAGAAYAEKFAGSGNVIVCYIGDGAVNQGAFHEACNLAGLWSLPLIVFVENNRYAVATRVQDACAVEPLSRRASAYAMDGYLVDGDDAIAILGLLREVAGKLRDGGTPAIIECECYRRYHHAGDVPGSAFRYRTREEEDRYAGTEVTRVLPRILVEAGLLDDAAVQTVDALAEQGVQAARGSVHGGRRPAARTRESVARSRHGRRRHALEWRPSWKAFASSTVLRTTVPSDDRPPDAGKGTALEPMRYSDAIAAVTGRWLEREADAIVFGEEVANLGGGAYGATKGLVERFPDRVINTPISEGRLLRAGFRRRHAGHARGGGDHVRGLRAGGRRPALQPALQGAPHVRRHHRPADRGAQPRRHRARLRGAALHGPGRPVRDVPPASGSSLRPTRTTTSACSTPPCTRSIRWCSWSTTRCTRSARRRRPATWTTPSPSARRAPSRPATR